MKSFFAKILFLIIVLNVSCKPQVADYEKNTELQNNLKLILSTFVQNELDKRSQYNPDKNKLIVFVGINYRDSLFRNSNLHYDIEFWSKNYSEIENTQYQFDGVDIKLFGNTNIDYVKTFNLSKKKKEVIKSAEKVVENSTKNTDKNSNVVNEIVSGYRDPFASMNVYFNSKNEITYIQEGYDEVYYGLLKNNITFNNQFWDVIDYEKYFKQHN